MKIQDKIILGFVASIIAFQVGVVVYDFHQKQRRIKILKEILDSYKNPKDSLFLYIPYPSYFIKCGWACI
jgi:hypothetical protein